MPQLHLEAQPGTEPWVLKPNDAKLLEGYLARDTTIEYWPRSQIEEPWNRDKQHAPDPDKVERKNLNFRGYSFASEEAGAVAVIIVDERETYESALFVVLHELGHLHAPDWAPQIVHQHTPAEVAEEEARADTIASRMMGVLGYPEGVYEAKAARESNPPLTICPL